MPYGCSFFLFDAEFLNAKSFLSLSYSLCLDVMGSFEGKPGCDIHVNINLNNLLRGTNTKARINVTVCRISCFDFSSFFLFLA